MACKDCFSNCEELLYDNCMKYTGETIEALGICQGDPISKVHEVIIETLLEALEGTNIVPADVTLENCAYLKEQLGSKSPNLSNLLQLLIDSNRTLKQLIDDLTPDPYSFNTACLSGLPANPNRDDILQSALNLLCSIKTTVDAFPTTYVKQSDLTNLVLQIVQNNQQQTPNTGVQYKDRLVPYVAVPYFGTLSNFDNTGKGLSSLGYDKVYLCNGSNGTPDIRGRAVVGAVRNIPGGTLDAAVNPTNSANIQPVDYSIGDKFGENFHKLINNEIPNHTHPVSDPGHKHTLPPNIHVKGSVGGGEGGTDERDAYKTLYTSSNFTGITIGATGGDQPHNNRQPSIAAVWIMYIP